MISLLFTLIKDSFFYLVFAGGALDAGVILLKE
jgi:hypothetical protein